MALQKDNLLSGMVAFIDFLGFSDEVKNITSAKSLEWENEGSELFLKARILNALLETDDMGKRDGQEERILEIVGDGDFDGGVGVFYDYLKQHLSLPCEVTGIEDFEWEEFYVFGPGSKREYEHLKKINPSYTDKYTLFDILREANSEWAMCYGEDLGACVRRLSDGKEFVLGLSELEATDKKSKAYELLDDYSVWFVNSR